MRHVELHLRCVTLVGLLLLSCLPVSAQSQNIRMQRVMARFVATTGYPMMGVGSWISGRGFTPGSSDFDMRMVWPGGGTEAQQLAHWQRARGQMTTLIRQEFGNEAGSILSRTNLYAPNQLMRGVEDSADAVERFQRLRTAPNLAHTGPITAENAGRVTEGVYGSGSQTYVQGYERGAGRLFYANNGRCVTGLSELAHAGETRVTYTAAGTANTAGQWAEHGLNELRDRQPRGVIKYLERLERDLVKSRSMSRLPLDEAYRSQLEGMRDLLKKSPEKLAEVSDDLARMLARGRAEAAILGGFENAGAIRRTYLRLMLDGVAARNKLGELVGKVMAKVPSGVNAESTMSFIVFCIGTKAAAESAGRGDDPIEALSNISGAINPLKIIGPLKLIGPALLAEITAEVIIQARANGMEMAAGSQSAWELMEGIYSAWGRAGVDPDPRLKLTLADLVANYQDESNLAARVMTHAGRASTRGLGTANEQNDDGVAQAIFAKCWPVIRDAWRWERDLLTSEYLQLGSEVVHMPLLIYYEPVEPKAGQPIACEARSADGKLTERLQRMREIIRILYGKGAGLAVNFYWEPGGTAVDGRNWQRGFTFAKPGVYPVQVRMEVAPYARTSRTEPRVMLTRTVPALVDIVVGAEMDSDPPPSDATRLVVNVVQEAPGGFEFWMQPDDGFLVNVEDEGLGVKFMMEGDRRLQTVLHPVGTTPPGAKRVPLEVDTVLDYDNGPGVRTIYEVPSGVPYHLELSFAVSLAERKYAEENPDYRFDAAFAEPCVKLRVSHETPAGQTTTQQLDTGVIQMDHTFARREVYVIEASAHFKYDYSLREKQRVGPSYKATYDDFQIKLATITVRGN
jgi:hypothetical protein